MFNIYYEEELAFLREMGAEFARANPAAAPFLAERGTDPDVERLLEGFAFLSGRIRQKIDDDFPELTQGLLRLLWPHYLRPLPATGIVQFEPLPAVKAAAEVGRHAELGAAELDGTVCRFRTTAPVRVLPLALDECVLEHTPGSAGRVRLSLRLTAGAKPDGLELSPLRLFLHGDLAAACGLHLHLTRRLRSVRLQPQNAGPGAPSIVLGPEAVVPCGFDEDEALLPYPPASFPGFRLLQEYLALPQKFLFVEVRGLPALSALGPVTAFELVFELAACDAGLRVAPEGVRLHCAPAVNLFPVDSDPLRVDHERVDYPLRAEALDPRHAEVFAIERVAGWLRGSPEPREIPPFHSFRHAVGEQQRAGTVYYVERSVPGVIDRRVDTRLAFVTAESALVPPPAETVVARLWCTNRGHAARLKLGDLSRPLDGSPTLARFRNITPLSAGAPPPLGGDLHWRVLSHLALNYRSLADVETLRALVTLYDFAALVDRQAARQLELRLAGIASARAAPEEFLHRGTPLRGVRFDLDMAEENFAGEGEMVLFATVLRELFAQYATLNSACRLVVRGTQRGEVHTWPPKVGTQPLV